MQHSESISNIAAALAKVAGEIENPTKNAQNPHFRNRYADLAEIVNTSREILAANGVVVVQSPGMSEGLLTVDTMLLHTSGEWIRGCSASPLPKADPQGVGSATTYLRRYSLAAMLGLAQEDDDGEGAVGRRDEAPAVRQTSTPRQETPTPNGDVPTCPKCSGAMWDNRVGKKNPKSPDFKCKDKGCAEAIWLDSKKDREPAGVSAETSYDDFQQDFPDPEDDLPFS